MSKIVLSNVADLTQTTTAATTINANSATIQTAMDNTLSRDGTSPNQMGASLDMNNNQIINLPSPGTSNSPVRLVDINSTLTPTPAILSGNNVYSGNNSFTGTNTFGTNATTFTGDAYFKSGDPWLDVKAFGATGNGSTDDTAAIQAAINAAAGRPVFLPPGTYRVTSQLHYITSSLFTGGLKLFGAGPGITIIDNQCTVGNACIYSAGNPNLFQLGGYIKGMTIKTTTSSFVTAIDLRAVYQYTVEDVWIIGLGANGMTITNSANDSDASNIVVMRRCRFDTCGGAGFLCNFTGTSVQTSFLRFEDCFFNTNTIAGLYWIGLQCTMINCAFATNTGPGLWCVCLPTTNNAQFTCLGTSFENNGTPQIRIDSLEGGTFYDTEIANSSLSFPCTAGVLFSGGTQLGLVSGVHMDGTRLRISSGFTPYTAFNFASNNSQLNSITNTFWQSFDAPGQVRYTQAPTAFGNRVSDSFDSVQMGASNGVPSITCVNGANENLGIPLEGTFFQVTGPSGAFNIGGFVPFNSIAGVAESNNDGRKLELHNASGQIMTINAEDAASSPANRIHTNGGSNITINNTGTASFRYFANVGRWVCLGVG